MNPDPTLPDLAQEVGSGYAALKRRRRATGVEDVAKAEAIEKVARPDGVTSNKLLETLADWNAFLEQRQPGDAPSRPGLNPEPRP